MSLAIRILVFVLSLFCIGGFVIVLTYLFSVQPKLSDWLTRAFFGFVIGSALTWISLSSIRWVITGKSPL